MRIGPYTIDPPIGLAPMAGVCDGPFKRVGRRFDRHSLLSTELVNGEAWLRGSHEMAARMLLHPDESPVAIQLSGHDPDFLGRAAAKAEAAGLKVVMNRCVKIEYGRMSGEIGWAGVNSRVLSSKKPAMQSGFQHFKVED